MSTTLGILVLLAIGAGVFYMYRLEAELDEVRARVEKLETRYRTLRLLDDDLENQRRQRRP